MAENSNTGQQETSEDPPHFDSADTSNKRSATTSTNLVSSAPSPGGSSQMQLARWSCGDMALSRQRKGQRQRTIKLTEPIIFPFEELDLNFNLRESTVPDVALPLPPQLIARLRLLITAMSGVSFDDLFSYGQKGSAGKADAFDYTSFNLANKHLDFLGLADIIASTQFVKKLIISPFVGSPVSGVAHLVNGSLLLDEVNLSQVFESNNWLSYLISLAGHWERPFPTSSSQYGPGRAVLNHLQLLMKFLVHALGHKGTRAIMATSDEENANTKQDFFSTVTDSTLVPDQIKISLKPATSSVVDCGSAGDSSSKNDPYHPVRFPVPFTMPMCESTANSTLWDVWLEFNDLKLLLGTNLPVFGDREHPAITIRLRQDKEPITLLTGIDYWVENVLMNIPELMLVIMDQDCIKRYERLKTTDIPHLSEQCHFDPEVIMRWSKNVLTALRKYAIIEGHTYWFYVSPNEPDEWVKVFDLTEFCGQCHESFTDVPKGSQNPFTLPISTLLHNFAWKLFVEFYTDLVASPPDFRLGTLLYTVLHDCLKILDNSVTKNSQVYSRAALLLSRLVYLPQTTTANNPDETSSRVVSGKKKKRGGKKKSKTYQMAIPLQDLLSVGWDSKSTKAISFPFNDIPEEPLEFPWTERSKSVPELFGWLVKALVCAKDSTKTFAQLFITRQKEPYGDASGYPLKEITSSTVTALTMMAQTGKELLNLDRALVLARLALSSVDLISDMDRQEKRWDADVVSLKLPLFCVCGDLLMIYSETLTPEAKIKKSKDDVGVYNKPAEDQLRKFLSTFKTPSRKISGTNPVDPDSFDTRTPVTVLQALQRAHEFYSSGLHLELEKQGNLISERSLYWKRTFLLRFGNSAVNLGNFYRSDLSSQLYRLTLHYTQQVNFTDETSSSVQLGDLFSQVEHENMKANADTAHGFYRMAAEAFDTLQDAANLSVTLANMAALSGNLGDICYYVLVPPWTDCLWGKEEREKLNGVAWENVAHIQTSMEDHYRKTIQFYDSATKLVGSWREHKTEAKDLLHRLIIAKAQLLQRVAKRSCIAQAMIQSRRNKSVSEDLERRCNELMDEAIQMVNPDRHEPEYLTECCMLKCRFLTEKSKFLTECKVYQSSVSLEKKRQYQALQARYLAQAMEMAVQADSCVDQVSVALEMIFSENAFLTVVPGTSFSQWRKLIFLILKVKDYLLPFTTNKSLELQINPTDVLVLRTSFYLVFHVMCGAVRHLLSSLLQRNAPRTSAPEWETVAEMVKQQQTRFRESCGTHAAFSEVVLLIRSALLTLEEMIKTRLPEKSRE